MKKVEDFPKRGKTENTITTVDKIKMYIKFMIFEIKMKYIIYK